jgi:acetyltransferase
VARREVEQSLAVARAATKAARETGKPVLMFSNLSAGFEPEVRSALEEGGVPYLQGTRETLRGMQAFVRYAGFRRRAPGQVEPAGWPTQADLPAWRERLRAARGALSEVEARRLLAAYGIPGPREGVAMTAEGAVQVAGEIGYPVVAKILSPDIRHKTEVHGVRVGLDDPAAVAAAFAELMASARRAQPGARLEGVVVQEMVPAEAVEVIAGLLRDPDWGPVLVFGSGGILVELLEDSALRLPPIGYADALEMIGETRVARLLQGVRGRLAADVEALAEALVRLSQLALDLGDLVAAVDINPLMVLPAGQGVRAVDALVELEPMPRLAAQEVQP